MAVETMAEAVMATEPSVRAPKGVATTEGVPTTEGVSAAAEPAGVSTAEPSATAVAASAARVRRRTAGQDQRSDQCDQPN